MAGRPMKNTATCPACGNQITLNGLSGEFVRHYTPLHTKLCPGAGRLPYPTDEDPLAAWESELLYGVQAPPKFTSTEEAQHWLDTHSSGG